MILVFIMWETFIASDILFLAFDMQGLYNHGARNFLLISSAPGGCSPIFLTEFNGTKDSHGCLGEYNTIYQQHRTVLRREVKTMRLLYADSQIIFADYFDAYMNILNGHEKYGKLCSSVRTYFIIGILSL